LDFQEQFLSRRLLYLTNAQAYFSCLTSERREDTWDDQGLREGLREGHRDNQEHGSLFGPVSDMQHFLRTPLSRSLQWPVWKMIAQHYSTRNSTVPADRVHAFQGIAEEIRSLGIIRISEAFRRIVYLPLSIGNIDHIRPSIVHSSPVEYQISHLGHGWAGWVR
jgi:hypothetical protein